MDHWWDDQGVGNCWEDNHYGSAGRTDNFTVPPPSCAAGGSVFLPGAAVKDAGFLTCSQYDRADPTWKHPPACEWFDSPTRPAAAKAATDGPMSGAVLVAPIAATGAALGLVLELRRRRRADA